MSVSCIHGTYIIKKVAETLLERVSSSSTQKTKWVNMKESKAEGKNTFKAPTYTRHALVTRSKIAKFMHSQPLWHELNVGATITTNPAIRNND